MIISVLGMDPSLTNWGLAMAELDLETGCLSTPRLHLINPKEQSGKQVRVNSKDLSKAEQLAEAVWTEAEKAKAIFVEVPVGSQSARAMASYGICVGILGSLRAKGIQIIEVTAFEVKHALSGNRNASKAEMIAAAIEQYPEAKFPMFKGQPAQKSEHLADAIGTIHAGVLTPVFQNLMKLMKGL